MDTLTPQERSERMRRVRQASTKPEMAVRHALTAMGLRYRLHRRDLPGSPDIVFPGRRKAIFVHGCFWHSHVGCRRATVPKSNAAYWVPKLAENRARDASAVAALEADGWEVRVLWECDTLDPRAMEVALQAFLICS